MHVNVLGDLKCKGGFIITAELNATPRLLGFHHGNARILFFYDMSNHLMHADKS